MSSDEKKEILMRNLDESELEAVSGGSADGPGDCNKNYYYEVCYSEVSEGSSCWFSGDYCASYAVKNYTQPTGCVLNHQDYEKTFGWMNNEWCNDNYVCQMGGRLAVGDPHSH